MADSPKRLCVSQQGITASVPRIACIGGDTEVNGIERQRKCSVYLAHFEKADRFVGKRVAAVRRGVQSRLGDVEAAKGVVKQAPLLAHGARVVPDVAFGFWRMRARHVDPLNRRP